MLESLQAKGGYEAEDYLERYIRFMQTPGSHRDTYVEEYHRHFFNNLADGRSRRKCGARDIHIGGLAHVPILAAWYADNPTQARAAVAEHVQLTHRSREVLDAADASVRILHEVFTGTDLRAAIERHGNNWVSGRKMERWQSEPDRSVIGRKLSPACYIADAFPASLYLAWKYAGHYENGVIANTAVGGDNCHRGVVVGALLGAACGQTGLPARWQAQLACAPELQEWNSTHMLGPH